ncbi:MAG: TerB family tellurite resistance protein [Flavobacteriia bacterium]|nr:TerB family tellurite resistance protein [Flavobacteriia bacterium]
MFKFILPLLAYFFFRSIALSFLAFFVGTFIDNFQQIKKYSSQAGSSSKGFSSDDFYRHYQQRSSQNDFATMLIALSAAVMNADGKVLKNELDFVKNFFSQQFGPRFTADHLQSLKKYIQSNQIPLQEICLDIRNRTSEEVRIQLLYYLFGIAKADGHVDTSEMNVIQNISRLLGLHSSDFESVKNMFYRDVNSDYIVLEITKNASDEEVKKAYRQMAIKYHPDKVASMGEEFQKGAKEKFQKIQEAYENIKKNRGMS